MITEGAVLVGAFVALILGAPLGAVLGTFWGRWERNRASATD